MTITTVSSQVPAVSLKGNGVSCFQEERGLSSKGKSVLCIYLMGFSAVWNPVCALKTTVAHSTVAAAQCETVARAILEQSYFPCGTGEPKDLLASSVMKGVFETSSSVHTTSPTACQALPSQSQGHIALGSLSPTLQQSPLGKLGGKYLLSMSVALGLTCSTPEPPATSIPEGSAPIP